VLDPHRGNKTAGIDIEARNHVSATQRMFISFQTHTLVNCDASIQALRAYGSESCVR